MAPRRSATRYGPAGQKLYSTFDDLKALLYRVLVDEKESKSLLVTNIKAISAFVDLNLFTLGDIAPHNLPYIIFDKARFDSAWSSIEPAIQEGDIHLRWRKMKQPSSPVLDVQQATIIESNLLECLESLDDEEENAESLAEMAGLNVREPDDDYRESDMETLDRIIPTVFDVQSQDTPHMACTLLNTGIADGRVTYSELIMLLRFMLSAIQHECKEKLPKQQRTVFPVAVYSISGDHARVIQGSYEDRKLNVWVSNSLHLCEDNMEDFKLYLRWMMSKQRQCSHKSTQEGLL